MPDFRGTEQSETLNGIDGTDRITGLGGNDIIDGRPQEDVSVYRGSFDEYNIEFLNDGRVRVTDNVEDRDGTDLLTSVEYAEFTDRQVGLQTGQDVVFLFDRSGSMGDDINAVLRNSQSVTDAIFNPENGLLDSRVAIVTYERSASTVQPFTNNPDPQVRQAAVPDALASIGVSGGTENIANALLHVMRGNAGTWREDATARQIFVFTDEPGNDRNRLPEVYTLAADITEGEGEVPLPVSVTTIALGPRTDVKDVMGTIAENTGGKALTASDADDLVDALLSALAPSTEGPDTLFGTVRPNFLDGLSGDDTLDAREGADTLLGRDGNDQLTAGQGNDRIWGGDGNDRIESGAGNDTASGGPGIDLMDGHRNNDLLRGNDGTDTVRGGIGNDTVWGGRGNDLLSGNQGHDTAHGGEGDDYVRGWGGSDRLEGGGGNDLIEANQGNDTAWGGRGFDTIQGGQDNDLLAGHRENDVLYGETGSDTLFGGQDDDELWGGQQADRLAGNQGNDLLRGGNGTDTLIGGQGDDTMIGGVGDDLFRGGEGADWVSYVEAEQGAVVNMVAPQENGGSATGDTFVSIEVLEGSRQNDNFTANDFDNRLIGAGGDDMLAGLGGDDLLQGGWGHDTLHGGDGDDILRGANGRDSLEGGAGADTFRFVKSWDDDTIADFESGKDLLHIDETLWDSELDQARLDALSDTSTGTLRLDFDEGHTITLEGFTSNTGLLSDIVLI